MWQKRGKGRWVYLPVLVFVWACGSDRNGDDAAPPLPPLETVRQTNDELTFTIKRYERIEDMLRRNVLTCDTLTYECPDENGRLIFCSIEGELLRATHLRKAAGETSRETYYFDEAEVILASIGESEHDSLYEQRNYFYAGDLLERRYKSYREEDFPIDRSPDSVPEKQAGRKVHAVLGENEIVQLATAGSYTCP